MRAMKVHNPNNLPTIPIADLLPTQGNLKDLTEKNYSKLKGRIEHRGFSVPVYVWEDDNGVKHLLDGHQRRQVLTTEGWNDPIPYLKIPAKDLQEAMARLLEITSQYATITQEGIDEFMATYELNEAEVYEATSFDALTSYGETEELEVEEDEAPEVDESEPPKSQLGEVYQLGRHRVMCADSTVKENVALLMDGKKADMVFTDPPYGMNLDTDYSTLTSGEGKSKKHSRVIGDDEPYDPSPLFDMFGYCKEIMLFGADYYLPRIPGWDKGNWLIWDKRETENYDKVIGSSFEVLWSKVKRRKEILRYEFVSWGKRMEDGEKTHPTMKPVKLLCRILDMTDSKAVVDLFLGSGSTLIACEQTDRTCYGMELDPKYVDVIRKRYAKFTNDNELPDNWEELTPAIAGK